jgi:predicted 2-oxoglutarate/Fe(II)-dependent dioxygenase YbiX
MRFHWNHYFYQSETTDGDTGGGADNPLGPKGEKALEATKQKARELEKQLAEEREKNKRFEGIDLAKVEEALKFQQEAAIREAEAKANTEEARKLEREQAAAEKKRLQAEKEQAEKEKLAARAELTETRIDAAIALNLANTGIKPQYTGLLSKDQEFRGQLAYMTKAADGVDNDGIYVVDKSGDPRYHPDDRNKYLPIDLWIETEIAKKYPDMFVARVGTGDGLSGRRGKRSGGLDIEALGKMSPTQRAEEARRMNLR